VNRRIVYVVGTLAGLAILAGTAVSAFAAPPAQTPSAATGNAGPGFGAGRGMMGWGGAFNMTAVVAKVLNLDVNAVLTDHQSGKSFVEIAQTKGMSEDALIKGILAERKTQLDQSVQAGGLTAEQAQLMLDRMDDEIKAMVEAKGTTGVGRGMMGGSGTDMPCWQGQDQSQTPGQGSAPATRGRGMMGGGSGLMRNR
jgi:hypothetical protein